MLSLPCMQPFFAFILLFIYGSVSTGFAVSTHYCMNKQQWVQIGAVKKEVCDKCGMKKEASHGCCRDEIKVVKLQQDTQLAKLLLPSLALSLLVIFTPHHLISPFYNFAQRDVAVAFQPPPLLFSDRTIANCVFRI